MALNTYVAFTDRMIKKYEGGYGWNRKDTGGPTKYGITCFDLAEHRGQKMTSMATWAPIVQAMTLAEAEDIYRTKYAAAIRYNDLPAGVDVEMYDYGVNSGISRPIRSVRAILSIPGGGVMDQRLLDAIKKADPVKLIEAISAERLHFMHAIRGGSAWAEFGGGWGARVADLKAYALHLAAAPGTVAEPTAPDLTNVSLPKAKHGDPEIVNKTVKGTVAAGTASGTGSHFAGMPPELIAILVGFVVVGGVGYVLYHKQKAANDNATVVLPPAVVPVALAA
jgi:lysozyme family protein